jgi:hypothetical protein
MRGLGHLQTDRDLLGKLERDLARLNKNPADSDAAFDFFVAAFHLLDWKYPDTVAGHQARRQALIRSEPLLSIAGHIANGAKHFEATRWNSVQDVRQIGTGAHFAPGYWSPNHWPDGYWARPRLSIVLTPGEAANLGVPALDVLQSARKLYQFWQRTV